jgi:Heparinase II/III-like protein
MMCFLAGLLMLTAAAGPAAAGPWSAGPASADVRACGPLPSFPAGTADQIMAGRLTIAPFGAVTIDPHRDGRINWAQDPFDGRSGWSPFGDQSFYSLRFGPGTRIHGHDDHMGLTYYARGRNLIVDAGHYGYANTPYRAYLLSPEAASDLVMPGVPFDSAAPTRLIRQAVGANGQFFEFGDTAFSGRPRYRSVYVDQDPDLVLVFDRASGAAGYQQLWHLDPGLTVSTVTRSYAVATAPGTQLEIRQIPLPGQQIPAASTQVVRGQVSPYQGWVSHAALQQIPAPVVTMTRTGSSAAILTLIAATAPGTAISATMSESSRGWYLLRVQIGGRQLSFLVSAGGEIEAG